MSIVKFVSWSHAIKKLTKHSVEVQDSWEVSKLTHWGKVPKYEKNILPALFDSVCLCESAFSYMKIIKPKYHFSMIDDHLGACLKLATCSYYLDYATLADSCKSSE